MRFYELYKTRRFGIPRIMFDFVRPKDRALWNAGADEFTDTYLSDFLGAVGEEIAEAGVVHFIAEEGRCKRGRVSEEKTRILIHGKMFVLQDLVNYMRFCFVLQDFMNYVRDRCIL